LLRGFDQALYTFYFQTMTRFRVLTGPFRGAPVQFDWKNGKRKILGIYEHETHAWWEEKLRHVDLFYDVGAADGFFTRGVAYRIRQKESARILAFEPGMNQTNLVSVCSDRILSEGSISLFPLLVGSNETEKMTTLDCHLLDPGKRAIVKIDVEGAELDVLAGASDMLKNPRFDWNVEIHGRKMIDSVQAVFERAGKNFQLIESKSHFLFGAEQREEWTGWIVTE